MFLPLLLVLALELVAACSLATPQPTPSPSPAPTARLPTPVPTAVATLSPTPDPSLPQASLEVGSVVLTDGRIIWQDERGAVLESQLTAAALGRVRAAIDIDALRRDAAFEATLRPGAEPIPHGITSHRFEVGAGSGKVVVTTVDPSSFADQLPSWNIPPEAEILSDLAAKLAEPVAWLGADAFVDPPRPYRPPSYLLFIDLYAGFGSAGAAADVDDVDWPFGGPIENAGEPLLGGEGGLPARCVLLDGEQGAATLAAEAAAGVTRDLLRWLTTVEYDWDRADGFVQVSLLPLLPYQSGSCLELGADFRS
jgi:hypothetical protein